MHPRVLLHTVYMYMCVLMCICIFRNVAIAQKYNVISVILQKGHNIAVINFTLTVKFPRVDRQTVSFQTAFRELILV